MKKQISILFLFIGILSAKLFAADFALSVNTGTQINQTTNSESAFKSLQGLPNFGIATDINFERFGLQFGFDGNFSYFDYSSTETEFSSYGYKFSESLFMIPYIPINGENRCFSFGPVLGLKFSQLRNQRRDWDSNLNKYNTNIYNHDYSYFIYGFAIEEKYSLTEKISVYFMLPILMETGWFKTKYNDLVDGKQESYKYNQKSWGEADLYIVPKFGLEFRI